MARGIVIASAAVAATVGSVVYPAGKFLPNFWLATLARRLRQVTPRRLEQKLLLATQSKRITAWSKWPSWLRTKRLRMFRYSKRLRGKTRSTPTLPSPFSLNRFSLRKAQTLQEHLALPTPRQDSSNLCNQPSLRRNNATHQKCTFDAMMRFDS